MKTTHGFLAASLGLAVVQFGCTTGATGDGDCARCDEVPDAGVGAGGPSPCEGVLVDHSGAGDANVVHTLNDPFAEHVLHSGDTCPTTFTGIAEKLQEFDTAGCESGTAGLTTRFVSETAQARGEAQVAGTDGSYRAVVTRACDGRPDHSLSMSLFGLQVGSPLPDTVEIMAFDEVQGVFNYYKTEGDRIGFFGNSVDLLKGASGQTRECALCHTGGGMIMKELNAPWVHWEDHMDTPGVAELAAEHEAFFGRKAGGINMESTTKSGNRAWNATRVAHSSEMASVTEMLEPLFCSVEVNLDNAAGFESPVEGGPGGDEVSSISIEAFLDPTLKSFGSVPIAFEDYDAAIKAMGQSLPGVDGAIDTVFDLAFVERAEADMDYVRQLASAGVIDQEFVQDVIAVDFTRPIFSDDRCDLLAFAPELPPLDRTPDAIRAGFIDALSGSAAAGTPAAELLANLEDEASDHGAAVDGFVAACNELTEVRQDFEGVEVSAFVANLMPYISLNRSKARSLTVFEFASTMPVDELSVPEGARLHPETCELTTEFVPVSAGG